MTSFVRSGLEFVVNTTQPRAQIQSDSTLLSNGNFVVTWVDRSYGTSVGAFVKAQIFQPDGTLVGVELSLESVGSGNNNPSIAGLASGGFVVTWNGIGGQKAQLYDVNGAAVGAVLSVANSAGVISDIVSLANGGFAITWNDNRITGGDVSGSGVRVSTYDQNGIAVVSQSLVNTATTGNQVDASIAALPDGGYVITWTDRGVSTGWQIKAQIYNAQGVKSGSEFVVNKSGNASSVESAVITLSNGNFAVAWNENLSGVGATDRIQLFSSQGLPIGAQIVLPIGSTGTQAGPVLTSLSDGGFVIGWVGNAASQSDGSGNGIFIQVYDVNALPVGGPELVNTQLGGDQVQPSITALANGGFVVNWTDLNAIGTDNDGIRAQIFMPDTNIVPPTDVSITSGGGGATVSISALENETAVTFVRATPAATSTSIQYSISGGADAALFTIDANTGLVRFVTAPNFESPNDQNGDNLYEVVVTASDGTLNDSQTLNISVPNLNEGPNITSSTSFTALENSLTAATITALDSEGDAITYALVSDPTGPLAAYFDFSKFSINATTGVLTFNTAPNFEAPADYGNDGVYNLLVLTLPPDLNPY